MNPVEFRKQRRERLVRNYAQILVDLLSMHHLSRDGKLNTFEMVLKDVVEYAGEIEHLVPNNQKKANFNKPIPELSDTFHFKEWQECCAAGSFIDYDGTGHPAGVVGSELLMDGEIILHPSECHDLPEGTTHVIWFNK